MGDEFDPPVILSGLVEIDGNPSATSQFGIEYIELTACFADHHANPIGPESYARRILENEFFVSASKGAKSIVWREKPQWLKFALDNEEPMTRFYARFHYLGCFPDARESSPSGVEEGDACSSIAGSLTTKD